MSVKIWGQLSPRYFRGGKTRAPSFLKILGLLKGYFGQKSDFSKIGYVKEDSLGETLRTKFYKNWPRYGASNANTTR